MTEGEGGVWMPRLDDGWESIQFRGPVRDAFIILELILSLSKVDIKH